MEENYKNGEYEKKVKKEKKNERILEFKQENSAAQSLFISAKETPLKAMKRTPDGSKRYPSVSHL